MGLYQDQRPTTLDSMVGQQAAVSQLKNFLARKEVPHVLLFSGPSGVGKTTAARIIASSLADSCRIDQVEKNAASDNGIDMVRDIEAKMRLKPLSGGVRVYIIDEAHAISQQGQRALLKVMEDTPKHVYFIFCTSNPEKLEKPFLNRCTHVKFGEIAFPELVKLLARLELGEAIPEALYRTIAEIIAFAWHLRGKCPPPRGTASDADGG